MKNKIIDCVTFFDNNFIFELRYNILKDVVDYFVVCESKFDHRNEPKKLHFDKKHFSEKKIKYFILNNPFPTKTNLWQNQAIQREFLLNSLSFVDDEDYIFFSDPDEIPNHESYKNFELKKKYGIFLQKFYNYKFNLFNPYETPWEGTKVCKKKNLKSIDFMREKIKAKNLKYKFYRFDKEKNIELFANGGWHFNNLLSPENISKKLKTFAHTEYSDDKFSSIETIKKKIAKKIDLFERGENYEKQEINKEFPKYLRDNLTKFKEFII